MEDIILAIVLFFIGAFASFLSGLLGVGGSAYLLPLILYVPPLFTNVTIDMSDATGLSIGVIWLSSLSASISHRKSLVSPKVKPLIIALAIPCSFFAFAGGFFSQYVPDLSLKALFSVLALFGGLLMCKKPKSDEWHPLLDDLHFSMVGAIIAASIVGIFAGLVGAGGAFLLSPICVYILNIPTRVVIASSMVVVFASSTASLIGKVLAHMVDYERLLWLALPTIPVAKLGVVVGKKVKAKSLRKLLAVLTLGMATKMVYEVIYEFEHR
ncbi:hypothetical protein GEMRC1_006741 [Eukaryota sp. GEM-RC1]